MTAREFADWQAFAFEHPLPAELLDIHGAMVLAMLANINRAKDAAAFDPRDFMILRPRAPKPTKPTLTMAQRMKALINRD